MLSLSIAARTFLLSFVPLCLALVASFYGISVAVKGRIKESLKASLHRSEAVLSQANANYERRNRELLGILSENAGLKAGIGLLREAPLGGRSRQQARETIEDSLREVGSSLNYHLLVVSDPQGRPVAAIATRDVALGVLPTVSPGVPLIEAGGALYQATTVPINLREENLGSLTVGRKFDIRAWNNPGQAVLLRNGRTVTMTFPQRLASQVERQLESRCKDSREGCEVEAGGESFLVAPVRAGTWGSEYTLLSLQSIDAALQEFTGGFSTLFSWIGVAGVMVALLGAGFASRSVSQPIARLMARLKESEKTGRLTGDFPNRSRVSEVDLLADAFNRAAGALQESKDRLDGAYLQFTETMAEALDARDPYTAGHSTRVSRYSTAIAVTLGLPDDQMEIIRVAAQLHDIGKIGIPDAVLRKAGVLTKEEFELIKLHPQIGRRILEKVQQFQEYLPIVELHHEDHDGTGYPYGLRGEQIPIGARIVHVADAYDAMTTDRAYRKALPRWLVLETLRKNSGTQFDPQVAAALLSVLPEREGAAAEKLEHVKA